MKNIILGFSFVMIWLYGGQVFAQVTSTDFKNFKSISATQKVVYFTLSGVGGLEQAQKIQDDLTDYPNVSNCIVSQGQRGEYRCKATISKDITPDELNIIIQAAGAEISQQSLDTKISGERQNTVMTKKIRDDGMPEHFPVFQNTGAPETDNANFEREKKDWMRDYPLEVEQLTGRSYDDVARAQLGFPEDYPKFVKTGNQAEDLKNFEIAKNEWFISHPEYLQK
jgi:hypothetical protein